MNSILSRSILLACILSSYQIHAIIHSLNLWQHVETGSFVCIASDINVDYNDRSLTRQQQEMLIKAALHFNAHVIFEGTLDYEGDNQAIDQFIQMASIQDTTIVDQFALLQRAPSSSLNDDPSIQWMVGKEDSTLLFLGKRLAENGCTKTTNIEYRLPYLASAANFSITLQETAAYIKSVITAIEAFNDGPAFKEFYEESIALAYNKDRDLIDSGCLLLPLDANKPIGTAYSVLLHRLINYTSELIDAFAVHAMYEQTKSPVTFVILSSKHAERIEKAMPNLGYALMQSRGGPFWLNAEENRLAVFPVDLAATFGIE